MTPFTNTAAERISLWSAVALSVLFKIAAATLLLMLVYRLSIDQEAGWMFIAGIGICLIAGRMSDVVSLEFGLKGMKAELATKVKQVEATLDQLHQIAKPWGIISAEQICGVGRWGGISRHSKATQLAEIAETLVALGSPGVDEVKEIAFKWDRFDYVAQILRLASSSDNGWAEAYDNYYRTHKGVEAVANSAELEALLNQFDRNKDETATWLEDYKHFEQHRSHRRPTAWFSDENE